MKNDMKTHYYHYWYELRPSKKWTVFKKVFKSSCQDHSWLQPFVKKKKKIISCITNKLISQHSKIAYIYLPFGLHFVTLDIVILIV